MSRTCYNHGAVYCMGSAPAQRTKQSRVTSNFQLSVVSAVIICISISYQLYQYHSCVAVTILLVAYSDSSSEAMSPPSLVPKLTYLMYVFMFLQYIYMYVHNDFYFVKPSRVLRIQAAVILFVGNPMLSVTIEEIKEMRLSNECLIIQINITLLKD